MKTLRWKEVQSHLRRQTVRASPRDGEAFKSDFKARTALTRQDPADAPGRWSPSVFPWGYAAALASLLIVLGVVGFPVHSSAVTQIKALEVVAPHSGVIIMNDQSGRGTILWITGMESKNNGG
jgi:hypothetical protein